MTKLHLELNELEVESLELITRSDEENEADLDSMMIGHGMLEIGASSGCSDTATCNSCCQQF
jgi:hypothetical protein